MFVQPRITKTYFYTSQKENRFPPEFIQSKNPRIIKVISCKLNYLGFLVGDVKVHASFIERDHYDDYFCIMANSTNNYVKKYGCSHTRWYFLNAFFQKVDAPFNLFWLFVYEQKKSSKNKFERKY